MHMVHAMNFVFVFVLSWLLIQHPVGFWLLLGLEALVVTLYYYNAFVCLVYLLSARLSDYKTMTKMDLQASFVRQVMFLLAVMVHMVGL